MKPCTALLCLLLALPAQAAATEDEMSPAARKHKQAGAAFMVQEQYLLAIREFERGFALDPKPSFLYELGQAEVLANRPQKAAASFRKYLALVPDEPNREELEDEIKALEARAAQDDRPASAVAAAPRKVQPKVVEVPVEAPERAPDAVLPQMFQTPQAPAPEEGAEEVALPSRGVAIPPSRAPRPGGPAAAPPVVPAAAAAARPAAPPPEPRVRVAESRPRAPVEAIESEPAPDAGKETRWALWAGIGAGVAVAAAVGLAVALASAKQPTEPAYLVDAR